MRERIVSTVCGEVRSAGVTDRTLLHSFDWALLAECRRQAPDMPLSFLTQLQDNGHDVGEILDPRHAGFQQSGDIRSR